MFESVPDGVDELVLPFVIRWRLFDDNIKNETPEFLIVPLMSLFGKKPRSKSHALFERQLEAG